MEELKLIQQQSDEINQKLNKLFLDNITDCLIGYAVYDDTQKRVEQLSIEKKIKILDLYFNDINNLKQVVNDYLVEGKEI